MSWAGGGTARVRRVLGPGAVAALLGHLEADGGLWVEVGRYMGEDKALGDSLAAWDAYHARGEVSQIFVSSAVWR